MYYTVIKHDGNLRSLRNLENTRVWLVFSKFLSCSQITGVFYDIIIHGFGLLAYLCALKYK